MPDNAFIEAFNGRFRAECLNAHCFLSLAANVRHRDPIMALLENKALWASESFEAPIVRYSR
ncbi:hypothetical protein [Bradyrhizobium yuanmingense]|uniref:hypothetical protein n=1 Tax=Bradyrhizobium yuanmingense TaxID=108015 RepID=UPI0018DF9AB9|nr:hypothetical protein [Bradyrhizobium yuanmingense]